MSATRQVDSAEEGPAFVFEIELDVAARADEKREIERIAGAAETGHAGRRRAGIAEEGRHAGKGVDRPGGQLERLEEPAEHEFLVVFARPFLEIEGADQPVRFVGFALQLQLLADLVLPLVEKAFRQLDRRAVRVVGGFVVDLAVAGQRPPAGRSGPWWVRSSERPKTSPSRKDLPIDEPAPQLVRGSSTT